MKHFSTKLSGLFVALMAAVLLTACNRASQPAGDTRGDAQPVQHTPVSQLPAITADGIMQHIKVLSSDEFEGRAPGTAGEEKTVQYLEKVFKDYGLQPGNTDGTYIQKVPLVGLTPSATQTLTVAKGAQK